MKTKRRSITLLILSSLICAAAQLAFHFESIPDFFFGIFLGLGMGLMFVAIKKLQKLQQPAS